jgi:hypothetical protein
MRLPQRQIGCMAKHSPIRSHVEKKYKALSVERSSDWSICGKKEAPHHMYR